MAARPVKGNQGMGDDEGLTAYELEREKRIRQNKAKIAALGLQEQATLVEASFRVIKKSNQPRKPRAEKGTVLPTRASSRLKGSIPENEGLSDDFHDTNTEKGKSKRVDSGGCEQSQEPINEEYRCGSQSRGSLYDSSIGITCHFCRQKKLCGEKDCQRCSTRNADLPCLGKSECSKCKSALGRFCRACLKIRYGMEMEAVREDMAKEKWLCPHCYEEENPKSGWMCNSSICMKKRGLKPTGIAIYDAQEQGFLSVAHQLQARILARKGKA